MSNQMQKVNPDHQRNMELATTHAETYAPPDANAQAAARNDAVAELTKAALANAGKLNLTAEESKALMEDFPDDAFQPGAAGKENLIYIEHAALRDRMNSALGLGQWALIVRENWNEPFRTSKGESAVRVYSRAMLLVRGCYVSEAVGDMVYYPNNQSQNYGDAFEGSKTAAFRRCAKEFGIGLQAWRKDWCKGWWERRGSGQRGPIPPMQRGSDLQQPQRKAAAQETVIDVEAEREQLQSDVDAQLDGDTDDVITTSIDGVEEKTGKTPKGKPWTRYDILTPKGRFSTFDKMIAGHAKEHIGGALVKIQYETVQTKTGTAKNCLGILS